MNITPELKEQIREYEDVKLGILSLEKRGKELKEIIFPLMAKDEKLQLAKGKLYLKSMPKWEFSPVVAQLDEQLTAQKATEKADGTATMMENYVLEYRQDKKEEEGE